jgi:iron complex transport system ATP-binding protein
MIKTAALTVRYNGTTVVDAVDLEVGPGEWLGIIGPNGAGKSSLLNAIAGSVESTGDIWLEGREFDVLGHREAARSVAVVPQLPVLPELMTVLDYVLLGRTPYLGYFGAESEEDVAIAESALWELGLIHLAERPIGSLSGGERQRCVLGRALCQQSPILLLDEPTSALDIGHRQQVLDHVADLRRTRGLAVLAAMHDLTLAAQYADRLALMFDGQIAAIGRPREVLTEETVAAFAGARVSIVEGPDGEIVVVPRRR